MKSEELKTFWSTLIDIIPATEHDIISLVGQLQATNTQPVEVSKQINTLFDFLADIPGNLWACRVVDYFNNNV